MDDAVMIILRIVHIFSGVVWVGATFFTVRLLQPAVQATGREGQTFMQHLAGPGGLSRTFVIASGLTILSGLAMMAILSGLRPAWFGSPYGAALTIGALAAILALVIGASQTGRATQRMGALGAEIRAGGGPPTAEQVAEMQRLGEKIARGGRLAALLLTIALLGMAVAERLG
ncbi:MAG: hypothetical protein ACRDHL_12195 [Candidatus Promineifilaceae bacterium]